MAFNLIPSYKDSVNDLDLRTEIDLLHLDKLIEETKYYLDFNQLEKAHHEYRKVQEKYSQVSKDVKSQVFERCQELHQALSSKIKKDY